MADLEEIDYAPWFFATAQDGQRIRIDARHVMAPVMHGLADTRVHMTNGEVIHVREYGGTIVVKVWRAIRHACGIDQPPPAWLVEHAASGEVWQAKMLGQTDGAALPEG